MKQKNLKKGVVYLYNGTMGADGSNIIFSVNENGSFKYHKNGFIVLHWSENRYGIGDGIYGINDAHLTNVSIASDKTAKYYDSCVKAGKDIGGFSWHDSNDEKR